jgi:tetratricopeptide (TPR) repeat protein
MTASCNACGKTTSLMNCKRCKSVAYCSAECQRRDWKAHKPTCQRAEFAGAPCDCCGTTENVQLGDICLNCGFLFCKICDEQNLTRDQSGNVDSFAPCPRCQQRRDFRRASNRKKLEKLIKESPRDPRLASWLVCLGQYILEFDDNTRRGERKAKEHFLHAGELGWGEGFIGVATIYLKHRNWEEARRYYEMAAQKFHVNALCILGLEAAQGFFHVNDIVQEDHRRPPDLDKAFRLFQEGAQLGDAECCAQLGYCHYVGNGTEKNLAKAFKWHKRAAEKGHARGMRCCASCYAVGEGVEQSTEQAIYWYEKSLELDENEGARANLQTLRDLVEAADTT